ncbi:MAG: hypothetical protein Q4A01_08885 [Coriobacteriales bacterium]|nr:hypothetical protein [Coriobacteriales bacterium]
MARYFSRLGGLGLCGYVVNKPLELMHDERASIGYRVMTPDFSLEGHNAVMEYLGVVRNRAGG